LAVVRDERGRLTLLQGAAGAVETTDAMRTVFADGIIVNPVSFAEVRATVRRDWAAYVAGEEDARHG
jgi:nicotinamide phosphoribosyltransferase